MAKILGIESASLTASVAVVEGEALLAEYTLNHKKTHSQTLLPMIDQLFAMAEIDKNGLDAIAVSMGPGSYTGLRIGSATAKGLGQALGKPLVAVPTMDAMAYGFCQTDALICPIMDARRNQVYTGLYSNVDGFRIMKKQCMLTIDVLLEMLLASGQNRKVLFLGDGVRLHRERIMEALGGQAVFAPPHLSGSRAGSVAALGAVYYENGQTQTAAEHRPEYLKASQAEQELNDRGVALPDM